MKVISLLLAAILCAVAVAAYQQHQEAEERREIEAREALQGCWANAVSNDGIGSNLCQRLADTLNSK